MFRWGHAGRIGARGPADPAQPIFRVNGKQGIGLTIAMRKGGDVLALGKPTAARVSLPSSDEVLRQASSMQR